MIVLDASAGVELLLRTARGEQVGARIAGQDLVAPELLDVEVVSALARHVRTDLLTAAEAADAVRRLNLLDLSRVTHPALTSRAWALRESLRIADAYYVACAALLSAPLLTCDTRLAGAASSGTVLLVK